MSTQVSERDIAVVVQAVHEVLTAEGYGGYVSEDKLRAIAKHAIARLDYDRSIRDKGK